MKITASTPDEYVSNAPTDRRNAFSRLRGVILANLPHGFEETMSYGMIGYVVPHSLYPQGYHVNPNLPLPFCSIAVQKNFLGFYHMGLYAMPELKQWFVESYEAEAKYKLDMGKSCVRLKRPDDIPYGLIGQLMTKVTPADWISVYRNNPR